MSISSNRMILAALLLTGLGEADRREATIDFVAGSAHGFFPTAGPEIGRAVKEIESDPAGYLPLLEARLDPRRLASADNEQVRQTGNCAGLLLNLGEEGRQVLAGRLGDLQIARDALQARVEPLLAALRAKPSGDAGPARKLADQVEAHMAVEQAIVRNFASARDGRITTVILSRLDRDVDLQLVYVEYLLAVAEGRPAISEALAKLGKTTPRPEVQRLIDATNRRPIQ